MGVGASPGRGEAAARGLGLWLRPGWGRHPFRSYSAVPGSSGSSQPWMEPFVYETTLRGQPIDMSPSLRRADRFPIAREEHVVLTGPVPRASQLRTPLTGALT